MPYDEALADRIRRHLAGETGVSEKKMFGGLAFLIGGHMAVAASGEGGLLVRVDPAEAEKLLAGANVRRMVMQGREMAGWLRVDPAGTKTDRQLGRWVSTGVGVARALPPKG